MDKKKKELLEAFKDSQRVNIEDKKRELKELLEQRDNKNKDPKDRKDQKKDHKDQKKDHKNHKDHKLERPKYFKPPEMVKNGCKVGCKLQCCKPLIKKDDPEYLVRPFREFECSHDGHRPVIRPEEITRKRAYLSDVLKKELERIKAEGVQEPVIKDELPKEYYEKNPHVTRSLDFLNNHPEFQIPGKNPKRIPHDELLNAVNGFANMHLAHEICLNHDFRLERFTPPEPTNSEEKNTKTLLQNAFWEAFDESLTEAQPHHKQAQTIFREIKHMLLQLLMPHNHGMRERIESFLDDHSIAHELKHHTLDYTRYSSFVIDTLGKLCCPVRDKQITALRNMDVPSEMFKGILELMEQMQLDMANFIITQMRPTLIANCTEYERLKFAEFIELEYRLGDDALRVTRSWIIRHRHPERSNPEAVAHAFAEIIAWKDKDWPETLTLDWPRYQALSLEIQRILYVGAVVYGCYNVAKMFFNEDDASLTPVERAYDDNLHSFPIRDLLKKEAVLILSDEDVSNSDNLKHGLDLLAEQAIKIIGERMKLTLDNREITDSEKDMIRGTVQNVALEENPIRNILLRRLQEYVTMLIVTSQPTIVEFPKALRCIKVEAQRACIEFLRIAQHNRAVYQDLYHEILQDKCPQPVFMDKHDGEIDPNLQKTIDILRVKATRNIHYIRPGRNEKLELLAKENGELEEEIEDSMM